MRPLTHAEWEKHYPELRPYVLKEFPEVDAIELDTARGDWDHLVSLIQQRTGLSSDLVERRLRKLDVAELGIGVGNGEGGGDDRRASLAQLRLGDGFTDDERDKVVDRLAQLGRRLRRFPADGTELVLSVKDRNTPAQHVRLELSAPHYAPLVATSGVGDLMAALAEVRQDMIRQITDTVDRRKEGR